MSLLTKQRRRRAEANYYDGAHRFCRFLRFLTGFLTPSFLAQRVAENRQKTVKNGQQRNYYNFTR
jgi:hypothetical protein